MSELVDEDAAPVGAGASVTVVGCGDIFASGGRFQTCFWVDCDDGPFLIDCGASSLVAMRKLGLDPGRLRAIVVTHLHGDHFAGLPFLLLDARMRARRSEPLTIAGPPGVQARTLAAMEVMFPGSSGAAGGFALSFEELEARRETRLAAITVTAHEVVHASGAPAYGVRVTAGGRVLAYSGDTEWCDALVALARDADLFICEAYFFDKRVRYHLDFATLVDHRDELRCRRLVLTHMTDDMLGRLGELDVEAAEDGARFDL